MHWFQESPNSLPVISQLVGFPLPPLLPLPGALAPSTMTHWWMLATLADRDGLAGPTNLLPRISQLELATEWDELTQTWIASLWEEPGSTLMKLTAVL